jgi:hypothetical protein
LPSGPFAQSKNPQDTHRHRDHKASAGVRPGASAGRQYTAASWANCSSIFSLFALRAFVRREKGPDMAADFEQTRAMQARVEVESAS